MPLPLTPRRERANGGEMTMGLADQMQNIADSFSQAQDLRTNRLKEIFEETNGDLDDTRKMMRGFHTQRLENTKALQEALKKATSHMLKQFRATHKAMSGQQRKELEQFMQHLEKETPQMLNGFRKEHREMSQKLREFLSSFVTGNKKETAGMLKGFRTDRKQMSKELCDRLEKFIQDLESTTHKFLRGCNTERKQMARDLGEFLAKFVDGNVKETAQMRKRFGTDLKGVHHAVSQLRKATHELTNGFHNDHMKARHAWQQMATSMEKKRRERPEQRAAASGPGRRGERENALVKLLKETPEGMTLAELSYAMDMPSAATSKILKHMLKRKDAAIRKKGQLYMPR